MFFSNMINPNNNCEQCVYILYECVAGACSEKDEWEYVRGSTCVWGKRRCREKGIGRGCMSVSVSPCWCVGDAGVQDKINIK